MILDVLTIAAGVAAGQLVAAALCGAWMRRTIRRSNMALPTYDPADAEREAIAQAVKLGKAMRQAMNEEDRDSWGKPGA